MVLSGEAMPPASWASSTSRGGRVASRVTAAASMVEPPIAPPRISMSAERAQGVEDALGERRLVVAAGGDRAGSREQGRQLGAARLLGGDAGEPVLDDPVRDALAAQLGADACPGRRR